MTEVPDREFWAAAEDEDDAAVMAGVNYDEDEAEEDEVARFERERQAFLDSPESDRDLEDDEPERW